MISCHRKNKTERKNSGNKKRKYISPLSDTCIHPCVSTADSSSHVDSTQQTGLTGTSSADKQLSKRVKDKSCSPEYFTFDSSHIVNYQPAMMNYGQQYEQTSGQGPFMQALQSSYSSPPSTQFLQPVPIEKIPIPPWATSIMEDIKSMNNLLKISVAKIDNVEKTVNSISTKLTDLEIKVKNIDERVADVEKSQMFVSNQYDEQSVDIKNAQDRIGSLKKICEKMESDIKECDEKQKTMNYKICDAENRSMQENLIFYGIPEGHSKIESTKKSHIDSMDIAQPEPEVENCKLEVKAFIEDNLSIDCS
jgi:hypothetical protein